MKFINLTPHKIVYDDGNKKIEIEPSGDILRLEYEERIRMYSVVNVIEEIIAKAGADVEMNEL